MSKAKGDKENKVSFVIQVDREVMQEIRDIAEFEERSVSSVIRQAIKVFLLDRTKSNGVQRNEKEK
ncbi:hypothetical protein [Endozoicomonas sp. SESOKO1]|uniref:hypothetical protein n=1 Tax=Endozoicomonas sp. SESOKO1 TaxID=2828742 RepID=UPI002148800C|nr:hypothetical protein [Endozoicomonas sp. SESOKO1]